MLSEWVVSLSVMHLLVTQATLGTVVNPIPGAISLDVSGFSPFLCKYGLD